ncbi:MAG: VanZ family protein [Porphyromonadaceae bacterium]|nr:MAG: VanZ family protein [Porphyromonadaceae bacterium]
MIRKLFIISLVWALLILILCAIPGDSLPKVPMFNIPNLDKIIHAALYFPLAFFLGAEFDLSKRSILRISGPLLTMLIISLYGGLIEILQERFFINRSSDIMDFLADVIGGLAGLTIYYLFFRPFFHRLLARKP